MILLLGAAGGLSTVEGGTSAPTEAGDRYGSALAAGQFDGDGFVDLAAGIPGADVGAATDAGAVVVAAGSSAGPVEAGQRFVQGAGGVGGRAERGDGFGSALAAADLDGDGRSDLAAGATGEDVGTAADAGSVTYLPGSAGGLTAVGSRVLAQGAGGSGAVSVLHGAAGGPSGTGDQLFFQGGGGLPDGPEAGDGFGSALALGRLDGDAAPDLAVGVPGEEYFSSADIGDVILVHGTAGGLSGAGSQSLILNSGVGSNEAGDRIGSALAARDFDADGAGDLAVGMPGEDIDKLRDAGAIAYHQGPVLAGNRTESRPLHVDSTGVPGAAEPGDRFGSVLGPGPLGS